MTLKKMMMACSLVALFLPAIAYTQSDRTTITGTVKDTTSAVVPGVEVIVTNIGTNEIQTAATDNQGNYRVGGLAIGDYAVSFSKNGFKTLERKGVTLLISQVAEIDGTLQVGGASETVVVTTAPPVLQTEDSALSTNLNSEAVSELPMNVAGTRALANFMFNYVPGVEGNDYNSHINGGMAFTKEVLIDGTSAVSMLGGFTSEMQPPMEAIGEFEADTAGISVDAGRTGGGVFRYEMKSGTNKMHGSLFGFLQTTTLDALNAYDRLAAITDPANAKAYLTKSDSLNDWGAALAVRS